jgi:hypothetical protein
MVLKSFTALNRLNECNPSPANNGVLSNKFNTYGETPKSENVGTTQEHAPEYGKFLGSAQEFLENGLGEAGFYSVGYVANLFMRIFPVSGKYIIRSNRRA